MLNQPYAGIDPGARFGQNYQHVIINELLAPGTSIPSADVSL